MKTKRTKKAKAEGESHATGRAVGRGKVAGHTIQSKASKKSTTQPVIAPITPMVSELFLFHDGVIELQFPPLAAKPLFTLKRVKDGTLKAETSVDLKERMAALVRGDSNDDVRELMGAFRRFRGLPADIHNLIYRDELDDSMRLNLACMFQSLQRFIADDLNKLDELGNAILQLPLRCPLSEENRLDKDAKQARDNLAKRIRSALDGMGLSFLISKKKKTDKGRIHPGLIEGYLVPKQQRPDKVTVQVLWSGIAQNESVPLAVVAIIHARRFIEENKYPPTKDGLRKILESEYTVPSDRGDSTWSGVWEDAGLKWLKRKADW